MSNILLRLALPCIRQTFSWNFEMNIFPIEQDYCVYSSVTFQCIENIFKKNHTQKRKKNGEKARNQMITAYKKTLDHFITWNIQLNVTQKRHSINFWISNSLRNQANWYNDYLHIAFRTNGSAIKMLEMSFDCVEIVWINNNEPTAPVSKFSVKMRIIFLCHVL